MVAPQSTYNSMPLAASSLHHNEARMSRFQQFISPKAVNMKKAAKHGVASDAALGPIVRQSCPSASPIPTVTVLPIATPSGKRVGFIRGLVPERIRTPQACERCRARKSKCCGTRPNCKRCLKGGKDCVYVEDHKANRPKKEKKLALRGAEARQTHRDVQYLDVDSATTGSRLPSLESMQNIQAARQQDQSFVSQVSIHQGCPDIAVTEASFDVLSAFPTFHPSPSVRQPYEQPDVSLLHPKWQPAALHMAYLQQKVRRASSKLKLDSVRGSSKSRDASAVQSRPKERKSNSSLFKPLYDFWSSPAMTFGAGTEEPNVQLSSDGSYEVVDFDLSNGSSASACYSVQTGIPLSPTWDLLTAPTEQASIFPISESADAELALAAELEREMAALLPSNEEPDAQFLPIPVELEQRFTDAVAGGFPSSACVTSTNFLSVPTITGPLDPGFFGTVTSEELAEAEAYLDQFMRRNETPMDIDSAPSSFMASGPDDTPFAPHTPVIVLSTTPSADTLEMELKKWMAEVPAPIVALNVCYAHPFGCPKHEDDLTAEIKAVADAMSKATVYEGSGPDPLRDIWAELFGDAEDD